MTILKNKEGGVKKFMVINKPSYGQGIAPKYPLRNFKDHEFMKEITDEIEDLVVLGTNAGGNEILHTKVKLPAVKRLAPLCPCPCLSPLRAPAPFT